MIHIRKSVFFFYAVLHQVLLSPGNIAMYDKYLNDYQTFARLQSFSPRPLKWKNGVLEIPLISQ